MCRIDGDVAHLMERVKFIRGLRQYLETKHQKCSLAPFIHSVAPTPASLLIGPRGARTTTLAPFDLPMYIYMYRYICICRQTIGGCQNVCVCVCVFVSLAAVWSPRRATCSGLCAVFGVHHLNTRRRYELTSNDARL